MVFIVMAFVVFLLFYSLTYSKSENKRKNQHKKYMSMIREEKNTVQYIAFGKKKKTLKISVFLLY